MAVNGVVYQPRFIRCKRAGCTKCPHGPYWYAFTRSAGKLRSHYVGKHLPIDLPQSEVYELMRKLRHAMDENERHKVAALAELHAPRHEAAVQAAIDDLLGECPGGVVPPRETVRRRAWNRIHRKGNSDAQTAAYTRAWEVIQHEYYPAKG